MPEKNLLQRRPAESATGSFGTLVAALIVALQIPPEWAAVLLAFVAWVPSVVTLIVERNKR